jgi:hypothetical protein
MAVVLPAALFVAWMVVRVAYVQAFGTSDPDKAAAVWPAHPTVLLQTGLADIGELAAAGRPVDRNLVDRLVYASRAAPLAPEPFLVRGVDAQMTGDQPLALRAFLAARQRNPRDIAPRYFLADHYLKAGQTNSGLDEISALARLVPQSLPRIAPYLAAYARMPSAAPQVRPILKDHPELELALLNELASDPENAALIIELWSGRGGEAAKPWQGRLLNGLVEAGRFHEARAVWVRITGISAEQDRLFDSDFMAQSLPPFGWRLASGSSGIAEPQPGGRLHVLYYGRDDLALASQLLTLPPGSYRLSMEVKPGSPPSPKSLSWVVRCIPDTKLIGSVPLVRSGAVSTSFSVSAEKCPAQRLELVGKPPELPERAEVTIGKLQLERAAAR